MQRITDVQYASHVGERAKKGMTEWSCEKQESKEFTFPCLNKGAGATEREKERRRACRKANNS